MKVRIKYNLALTVDIITVINYIKEVKTKHNKIMLHTKEHIDLINQFEKVYKGERFDKEDKKDWTMKQIYQDGMVNKLFLAFRLGSAYGKSIAE